ncbi:hypothetical protein GCM10009579_13470 [Streptomyces javensis]|uniref:Uncharacterized protein n=1 Tax=Streptomyces javensis TaxID=114698 RepID=A0ABN1WN85_9ACTN
MRPRPMPSESPSKTDVPSAHWKDRAEQVTEVLGVGDAAMVFSQFVSAVKKGLRMRAPRGDQAGEWGAALRRVRDGVCTEVASTRVTGGGKAGYGVTATACAVPRDDREPQIRNVHLYRRQQDPGSLPQLWPLVSWTTAGRGRTATFLPTFPTPPPPRTAAVTITRDLAAHPHRGAPPVSDRMDHSIKGREK